MLQVLAYFGSIRMCYPWFDTHQCLNKWENQNKVLSHTYKSLKTGQPSYLPSLLSFPSHRYTRSSALITLSHPSLTSRLKIANRSYYHSAPVLLEQSPPISSTSGCSSRHSFSYFKLACVWSFNLSFRLEVENPSLSLFLSTLICIHLGYFRTDISAVLTKLRLFISHTFRYHSPSYHSHQFLSYLTCKCLWISSH